MNQRATLAQECLAECSLLLFPRWEHVVQDTKGKTPLYAAREQVQVSEQSHEQLMDSFYLPPPCAHYQYFMSDIECISFPPRLSWGGWSGQSVVQWEQVACRWELSGSLSWREGNKTITSPAPFQCCQASLPLRWPTVRNIWKLLAWVSGWILKFHICTRKQKKNKSVASSVILKRAWSSCLKWELVLWNLGCLVKSTG